MALTRTVLPWLALAALCACAPAPRDPEPPREVGHGPAFLMPESLKPDRDGTVLVVDALGHAILSVDPRTGARRPVFPGPATPREVNPRDATRLQDGPLILAVEGRDGARVVRFGPDGALAELGRSGPRWQTPWRVEALPDGRVAVMDPDTDSFFALDVATGERTLLSGPGRGSGPRFGWLQDCTLAPDGTLLAVDESRNAVLRVDPSTGDRTQVADLADPRGPAVMAPAGIGMSGADAVLVTEPDFSRVFEVDLRTGVQRVLAAGTWPGTPILVPMDALRLGDGEALVTCSRGPNVLGLAGEGRRVASGADPVGERQEVAPSACRMGPDGLAYYTDPTVPGVGSYDAGSGELREVSGPSRGTGPAFRSPTGLAVGDGTLYVTDRRVGLVAVDPATGDRRVVLPDGGRRLRDVEVVPGWPEVLVIAYHPREIFAVDPRTGKARQVVTQAAAGTPDLEDPNRLARTGQPGEVLVGSSEVHSIFRLDLATNALTLVTGPDRGGGPVSPMQDSLALLPDGTLFFGNSLEGNVVRVDSQGNRSIAGGRIMEGMHWGLRGTGPRPLHVRDLAVLPSGRLLIADPTAGEFMEMDPATGDRRTLPIRR